MFGEEIDMINLVIRDVILRQNGSKMIMGSRNEGKVPIMDVALFLLLIASIAYIAVGPVSHDHFDDQDDMVQIHE
jgi:hypothetical protein